MIFSDRSELQYLPNTLRATSCDLESWTGADLMLSTWDAPGDNQALLEAHLERGALLVQIKRGPDLLASRFNGRLHDQLGQMKQLCQRPTLLFIGMAECSRGNKLLIDGQPVIGQRSENLAYHVFLNILETWQDLGGYWSQLDRAAHLALWCNMWMKRLAEKDTHRFSAREPVKDLLIFSSEEVTLSTLPGVGVERAHALWKSLAANGEQSLAQALHWITAVRTKGHDYPEVTGWGKRTRQKCKEYLGISSDCEIVVEPCVLIRKEGRER